MGGGAERRTASGPAWRITEAVTGGGALRATLPLTDGLRVGVGDDWSAFVWSESGKSDCRGEEDGSGSVGGASSNAATEASDELSSLACCVRLDNQRQVS